VKYTKVKFLFGSFSAALHDSQLKFSCSNTYTSSAPQFISKMFRAQWFCLLISSPRSPGSIVYLKQRYTLSTSLFPRLSRIFLPKQPLEGSGIKFIVSEVLTPDNLGSGSLFVYIDEALVIDHFNESLPFMKLFVFFSVTAFIFLAPSFLALYTTACDCDSAMRELFISIASCITQNYLAFFRSYPLRMNF
jgi:hypothetical protein